MKYLKTFQNLNEAFINPIQDYLTDFLDFYDCEIKIPDIGIIELNINAKDEDYSKLLLLYQELINRIKDDEHIIKNDGDTFITFYEGGKCCIRIVRVVKDKMSEYEFETEELETAYKAIVKCLRTDQKLIYAHSQDEYHKFNLVEGDFANTSWVTITNDGLVKLPILRGKKSNSYTELPFNDLDCRWFKRIIILDDNLYHHKRKELSLLHSKSQEELRKIYK